MAIHDPDVESLHGRRSTDRVHRLVVGDILERLTWSTPDKVAIQGWVGAYGSPEFEQLTYREADEAANRVAHALLAAGLQRSDRVALLCENSVETAVTMLGIAKAGLVCVPLNPLHTVDVVHGALEQVQPRFAIVDDELWPRAATAFDQFGLAPAVTIPIGGGPVAGSVSFADWIADQPSGEPDVVPPLHSDDIWIMLFTSGTTAAPKAAMYSHVYSYMASMSFVGSATRGLRYEDELRLCTFLPIVYHCGHNATFLPAFLAGGTAIIGRRFDPAAAVAAVTEQRATALWAGAPRFLDLIATAAESDPAADLHSLTVAWFSWSAMAPELAERLRRLCGEDLQLFEVFGQTEAMSCFRFWLERWPDKVATSGGVVNHVGIPNPLLAATIMDSDGTILQGQPGVPGEAVFRSPAVTSGYYRNPDATREAFRTGWFHSEDSCMYEPDGSQVMVDRYKDIVKTGGENVSSLRVETVVAAHPGVKRAAVIGLPDERWGEMVTAVVVAVPGAEPTEAELISWCRDRLAGYETPRRVVFVESFPQTVGEKILKYKLRQRLISGS